jgi:xanthine dehydrogenase YagR molybdenum-binding subunit
VTSVGIGARPSRLDARAKVTGQAKYAGDLEAPEALHAILVLSGVCSGRVLRIDVTKATALSGVVGVMTHENAPRLAVVDGLALVQNSSIVHAGQPLALVTATTRSAAHEAAALVHVDYESPAPFTGFERRLHMAVEPPTVNGGEAPSSIRGNPERALRYGNPVRVDAEYTTPMHVHSPMEPHTVIARWEHGRVLVQTATSGIFSVRAGIARAFALAPEHVHVISPSVGGGFCAKNSAWLPCLILAVSAAKLFGRPIRLELTREQMFTAVGNRQRTVQRMTAAADRVGRLVALRHDVISETGPISDFSETTGFPTRIIYECPNVAVRHRVVRTHTPQPLPMRGPGDAPGSVALECALDELAEKLVIDPVELRVRNWAQRDQHARRPWSSNSLRECLRVGASAFGWDRRGPAASMRDGRWQIGWGMASSYYPGFRAPAAARVRLQADGTVVLECGNQEIGTGACTVMAQAAADVLKTPIDSIDVRSGDSSLPEAPAAAGAKSTASVVPAVEAAARSLQQKVIALARSDRHSPLFGRPMEHIEWVAPTSLQLTDQSAEECVPSLLARVGAEFVEADARVDMSVTTHSVNTFGACYAEVRVDRELGQVRVERLTAAYAAGRIMNATLARSQLIGGIVFGIGMALYERAVVEPRSGLIVNRSLTDYLLPVHADVPAIDIHLVPEDDPHVPSGVKGLGMNGTVGTAAAIANAVHHATGVRVRDLPIVPETLVSRSH